MEAFLVYLLRSSGIIALFVLFYLLFLKRETFFRANRIYLLTGMGFAIIVPFLIFTKTVWLPSATMHQIHVPDRLNVVASMEDSIDWIALALYGYCTGVFFFAIRFAVQLLSLKRLIGNGNKIREGRFVKVETDQKSSPFSFFAYLVYNPDLHTPSELGTILAHESIHARERHSLDILTVQFFTIFQWCNPFIWWYRTFLYNNLEYLADTGTIAKNIDRTEYQYLLLRTGMGEKHYPMATPFFNNSIKKRIIMLNKNRSNRKNSFKYVLMLPLLLGFIFLFNVRTEAQIDSNSESTTTTESSKTNMPPLSNDKNKYNPVTYDKEHTGDFPVYNINSNDNNFDDILTITKNELPGIYVNDKTPLYLVDGKEVSKTEFDKIDPNSIESVNIWKGQRAIDKYGERAKDGVIEIRTKSKWKVGVGLNSIDPKWTVAEYYQQMEKKAPSQYSLPDIDDALIILDGTPSSKQELESITGDQIKMLHPISAGNKDAIKKYGDQAKNGVIEIVTKKE